MITLGELHRGVPMDEYRTSEGVSASTLNAFRQARSPRHFKHAQEHPKKPSEAFDQGRAIHSVLENGRKFLDNLAIVPDVDKRTKTGKEAVARFYADLRPGAVVVEPDWVDDIKGILNSMESHPRIRQLIGEGTRESSLWVHDPEFGLTLKCRPDLISAKGFLVDFKSTRDASKQSFLNDIFSPRSYLYSMQMAHYCHCLRLAGLGGDSATIVAIEKEPPYEIAIYPLDVGCLAVGESWWRKTLTDYAKCVRENDWPGYPRAAQPVEIPVWANGPTNND